MAIVSSKDAAHLLFNVATILELSEDNPYRIRAYRRAARLLLSRPEGHPAPLVDGKEGKELDLPGLGTRLRRKLGELLSTGRMRFYVELCAEMPDDVSSLMQIPGVGPKTALRLHEELGAGSPQDVFVAAQSGRVRALYGFGAKRERQLLDGAAEVTRGNVRSFVPGALPTLAPSVDGTLPATLADSLQPNPLLALPAPAARTLPEAA